MPPRARETFSATENRGNVSREFVADNVTKTCSQQNSLSETRGKLQRMFELLNIVCAPNNVFCTDHLYKLCTTNIEYFKLLLLLFVAVKLILFLLLILRL